MKTCRQTSLPLLTLSMALFGAVGPQAQEAGSASPEISLYPVIINGPDSNPTVEVGLWSDWLPPNQIECHVCHRVTAEEEIPEWARDLRNFHTELRPDHGGLSCGACHDSNDHADLILAGGEEIGFEESMALCSQCHSEERADFDVGLHGGMTGHWDLTRGPRQRRHCIDCHDSHRPVPQTVTPVFAPRDRSLAEETEGASDE